MSYLKGIWFHITYSNKQTKSPNAVKSRPYFLKQKAKYAHLLQYCYSIEKLDSSNPLCQGHKLTLEIKEENNHEEQKKSSGDNRICMCFSV